MLEFKSHQYRYVSTRHGMVACQVRPGVGTALVLVHGSGYSSRAFIDQFHSPIFAGRPIIAIDLPGHGCSADAAEPDTGYSLQGFSEALVDALDGLGVERCVLGGWSLGGNVVLEAVARGYEKAEGILLIGMVPARPGLMELFRWVQPSSIMLQLMKSRWNERQITKFAQFTFGDPAPEAILADLRRADGRFRPLIARDTAGRSARDTVAFVQTCGIPVGMILGQQDRTFRNSYLKEMQKLPLWNGGPLIMSKSGHAPFHDSPRLFNLFAAEFCRDVCPDRHQGQRKWHADLATEAA